MARFRRRREALPERRTAFRFPVQGSRSEGVLRAGDSQFAVTVIDESAGGYAVAFVGPTQCRIGDILELSVTDQWIAVRVVSIDMEDIGVERITNGALQGQTRLGLERLPEHVADSLRHKGARSRFRRPLVMLRKNGFLLTGVAFLAALSLAGFALTRKLDGAYALNPLKNDDSEAHVVPIGKSLKLAPKIDWAADAAAAQIKSAAKVEGPSLSEHIASRRHLKRDSPAHEEPPRARQAVITRSTAPPTADKLGQIAAAEIENVAEELSGALTSFDESAVRLADPQFLLRQDVVQRLQLTHAQQVWLRRLVVEHRTAGAEGQPDELAINRRALNRLTSEQRKLLMAFEHALHKDGQ